MSAATGGGEVEELVHPGGVVGGGGGKEGWHGRHLVMRKRRPILGDIGYFRR